MRTFKNYIVKATSIGLFIIVLPSFLFIQSCKNNKKEAVKDSDTIEVEKEHVIEIVTKNMDFQMPDTIPSGWNIFRYKNQTPHTHFFLIEKYPEGKTLADAKSQVVPYFSSGLKQINEGNIEKAMVEFGKLPEWYSKVQFSGGSGLVSADKTIETAAKLEPGYYLIECYVKMSNGEFHTAMGMIDEFIVSDHTSGNEELTADFSIEISSHDGIVFKDSIPSGKHTFSVTFKDQIVHENFVGHDINLVKLDENASLEELESWMNWANPKGLIDPAPTAFTFLGGVNNMPSGSRGYFITTLEPGLYALVSEVPKTLSKNMLKTFKVYK